jgi:hypothetical protein
VPHASLRSTMTTLSIKQLLENLLKGPHIAEREKGIRLQQEDSFVLAHDRCRDERTVVSGQLERARDRRALPDVEHVATIRICGSQGTIVKGPGPTASTGSSAERWRQSSAR